MSRWKSIGSAARPGAGANQAARSAARKGKRRVIIFSGCVNGAGVSSSVIPDSAVFFESFRGERPA
jgi:hypothetical protein